LDKEKGYEQERIGKIGYLSEALGLFLDNAKKKK
jgi:hypothetical protein